MLTLDGQRDLALRPLLVELEPHLPQLVQYRDLAGKPVPVHGQLRQLRRQIEIRVRELVFAPTQPLQVSVNAVRQFRIEQQVHLCIGPGVDSNLVDASTARWNVERVPPPKRTTINLRSLIEGVENAPAWGRAFADTMLPAPRAAAAPKCATLDRNSLLLIDFNLLTF